MASGDCPLGTWLCGSCDLTYRGSYAIFYSRILYGTKVEPMHAVIQTGGKQYRVKEGDLLSVEKLDAGQGQKVSFSQVLLIEDGGNVLLGLPVLEDALVRAEAESDGGRRQQRLTRR